MSALGAYWFGDGDGLNTVGGLNLLAFGRDDYWAETKVDDIILEPMVSGWM